jgi:hypothetical protein
VSNAGASSRTVAVGLHFDPTTVTTCSKTAEKRLICAGRRAWAAAVVAGISLLGVAAPTLAIEPASELAVKAAFIVNFLKFVEWPDQAATAGQPLVIVMIGDDPLAAVLKDVVAGINVGGRPVQLRAAKTASSVDDGHVVFISGSQHAQLPAILRQLDGRAVLTVGATDGFAASGVVLNLVVRDRKVRVEANTTAAARARLRVSAHLLRLARIVG